MFNTTKVFISYRRNSISAGYANAIYEHLKKYFRVFFDTNTIEYGERFEKKIKKEIVTSKVVLALLDKNSKDEFQKRMKSSQKDYVVFELETAYKNGIHIIPILIEDAQMPSQDDLPSQIRFLPYLNAFNIRHDKFSRDVQLLIDDISNRYGNSLLIKRMKWCCIAVLIIATLFFFEENIKDYLDDHNVTGQSIFSLFSLGSKIENKAIININNTQ